MRDYRLYIEDATLTFDSEYENSFFDFKFTMIERVNPDIALAKASRAIKEFKEYLVENNLDSREAYYNIANRSFLRLGKFKNGLLLDGHFPDDNKVYRSMEEIDDTYSIPPRMEPYIMVYAIDGTPFKGFIFCSSEKRTPKDEFFNYQGSHQFYVTNGLEEFIGTITVEFADPGYFLDLNSETQAARYGDFFATGKNIFNVSTSRVLGSEEKSEEYSIRVPGMGRFSKSSISTTIYETMYDDDRFDMRIDIPVAFQQRLDTKIEPDKVFAERLRPILKSDIKHRIRGVSDLFSIEYAPLDVIDDVFSIARDVVDESTETIEEAQKREVSK
ncbi:MAG: hypothetical protein QW393_04840 [Candidatus Micrarchaeaceae archaeon]